MDKYNILFNNKKWINYKSIIVDVFRFKYIFTNILKILTFEFTILNKYI